MLYEELKSVEKLIDGNEFIQYGASYYWGIYNLDSSSSLKLSLKQLLINELDIDHSLENIVISPIKSPQEEIEKLCFEWHFDKQIIDKIMSMITGDAKIYKICDDNEFISKGNVYDIFRLLEKNNEWVLMEFYLVD